MAIDEDFAKFAGELQYLKLLAHKAIDMAMDAMVELKAMKQSTHQVVAQPLAPELKEFVESMKEPERESEPVPKQRVSPFNLDSLMAARRASITDNDIEDSIEDLVGGDLG